MRWIHQKPKLGERKSKRRFALFPTKMTSGGFVWLEPYQEIIEYSILVNFDAYEEPYYKYYWKTIVKKQFNYKGYGTN